MPNKTKKESNTSSEQLNRRRSARLAGIDKEKPTESPKVSKKEPAKKKSKKVVSDKMSKGDVELESNNDNKNHNDQNDEVKEEDTKKNEENETNNDEVKKDEVVKKNEVPSPDSDEVKEAIKAQGEDGELLVNFVQVTHDDVPDAKVVPATVNGICTTNNLDTEKTEEPQQLDEEPKATSV